MAITSFSSSETVAQLFSSMCNKMLVYSCIFVIRLGDASGTEMNFYYFECLNNKTIEYCILLTHNFIEPLEILQSHTLAVMS